MEWGGRGGGGALFNQLDILFPRFTKSTKVGAHSSSCGDGVAHWWRWSGWLVVDGVAHWWRWSGWWVVDGVAHWWRRSPWLIGRRWCCSLVNIKWLIGRRWRCSLFLGEFCSLVNESVVHWWSRCMTLLATPTVVSRLWATGQNSASK